MKVFASLPPTDHFHRMKVFASLFSKSDQVEGSALVASAEAKLFYAVFGSFCSSLLKKNGNDFLT